MSALIGSIPEQVTLIGRKPYDVPLPDALAESKGEKLSVVEVFVSDATNERTKETGRKWAQGWNGRETSTKKPYEITRENEPMRGIRILDLEHRGQGGRAYKVILPNGTHYVDLREDVLLDTIMYTGISAGGLLNGEFVFARVGAEMKLVRVGSKLHDELVEATKVRKTPVITLDTLVPGHAYETKGGMICVYLGRGDADQVEHQLGDHNRSSRSVVPLLAVRREHRDVQVWLDYEGGNSGGCKRYGSKHKLKTTDAAYVVSNFRYVKFVSDRSVVKDLGACRFGADPIAEIAAEANSVLAARLRNPDLSEGVKSLRQDARNGYYSDYDYSYKGSGNRPKTPTDEAEKAMVWYELAGVCSLRKAGTQFLTPVPVQDVKQPPLKSAKEAPASRSRYSRYSGPFSSVTGDMIMVAHVLK